MKLFTIEKTRHCDYYTRYDVDVLGYTVVDVETSDLPDVETALHLGPVSITLYLNKPSLEDVSGADVADVELGGGIRLIGPDKFRFLPVPFLRVELNTFVGYLTLRLF
jgi:hypothetical protein